MSFKKPELLKCNKEVLLGNNYLKFSLCGNDVGKFYSQDTYSS